MRGDYLIVGDNLTASVTHNGANVMAVNRHTGTLRWITQVDKHPAAIITGSPVFFGDVVYVGVSSNEEGLAVDANYPCCSFRGSLVALNADTGQILWETFTMPDNHGQSDGCSGGAIWQPPAIDPARGYLYIGTGNNCEVPQSDLLGNIVGFGQKSGIIFREHACAGRRHRPDTMDLSEWGSVIDDPSIGDQAIGK